jgi:hypothetical protein
MLFAILFGLAVFVPIIYLSVREEWRSGHVAEHFLASLLFFVMGWMGILAAYAHVFMGPEIAKQIGWAPGSPFQYEIGMANLAFGVLGVLSYWIRGHFWTAAIIGWSVLLIGCFIGHVIDYQQTGNDAPYNIGIYIWVYDLLMPLVALGLLAVASKEREER